MTGENLAASIRTASLVNRERATRIMRRVGLDGIVVTSAINVYYLSSGIPLLSRFTQLGMTAAVIPSNPKEPIAYIALMRKASAINVAASRVTVRATREEGSLTRVRERFFTEASRRGNVPVYAGVDTVAGELTDGDLREGQACMLDFVSHHGFYQGDYGRTVFFGEPDALTRRAARVGVAGWEEIRSQLRPGLKFSEIRDIGVDTVDKQEGGFVFAFVPHSVGLQHRDQPLMSPEGEPHDMALEAGMILSADCPCLNAGINGTIHFEDLMLITKNGAEALHEIDEYITTV
jgi:Xaa-Pro aminopeptidase